MMFSSRKSVRAAAGLFGLLLLAACATGHQDERINAVKDLIEVAELEEVQSINTSGRLDQEVLNDKYVILSTRKQDYLLEYSVRCLEDPFTQRVKPDVRYDSNRIYAGSDTYRGCQIRSLYVITPDQAEELRTLGQAPGE